MKYCAPCFIMPAAVFLTATSCPPPDDGGDMPDPPELPVTMFVAATRCITCHTSMTDESANDVSIDSHWRSTMMANAARDPYWQAKLAAEVERLPEQRQAIEDTCARCHMPMARLQAIENEEPVAVLDDGFLNPEHPLHALAMDGVSCAVCHQIQDVNLGEETSFNGNFVIDDETPSPDREIFGPFANPDGDLMRQIVGFTPVMSSHIRESALCATCHTFFTDAYDAEGNVVGRFPEQTPFLEWRASAFADGGADDRTCQECHMPQADGEVVLSTFPDGLAGRSPFAQHHFVGGNAFMLRILRDNRELLGVDASSDELDATIDRTLTQLEQQTAAVSIEETIIQEGTLDCRIRVENFTGHKLPTSFPSRRAWVHFTVTDAEGQIVFESGAVGPGGEIIGDDAADDITRFEPHHESITDPGQIQIYETVMHNSDGQVTFTLLRAFEYAKDNRLLPLGFDKEAAGPDISVRGRAFEDDDFIGGSDAVFYQIPLGDAPGPYTVRVELLYRSIARAFVDDLRTGDHALITQFVDLFDAADHTPTTLAADEAVTGP